MIDWDLNLFHSDPRLLERSDDDAYDRAVKRARVLPPLFPRSLLAPGALDVERPIAGPEDEPDLEANGDPDSLVGEDA